MLPFSAPSTITHATPRSIRLPAILLALTGALLLLLLHASPTAAHAELDRADPPVDGLLAAPPLRLELWFTEAVDQGAGSPSVRLFDAAGNDVAIAPATIDPADARHVIASVHNLDTGTFTVGWSVRSADDGHTLSGTYGFRVGAVRAPGAATVQGETPAPWAVLTRWLTFLGAALATAGFAYTHFVAPPTTGTGDPAPALQARSVAIAAGAAIALLATLAEPLLQTLAPSAGLQSPSLAEAVQSLPRGWWLRLVALALVSLLALALLSKRRALLPTAAGWLGLSLGLAALLGLSLTSHGAARETWRPLALASNLLHQWAIALWVGGLAHLALSWPAGRATTADRALSPATADPVRRFSRLALALMAVGVTTGLLNAGLILPSVSALWSSAYGIVLLLKLLALVPVLVLATFHRATLRRAAAQIGTALVARRTVRLEGALALLVVLGGSILTLLAPPGTSAGRGTVTRVDLAANASLAGDPAALVHLQLQPAQPGDNGLVVRLLDARGDSPPPDQLPSVQVAFTSLDHPAPAATAEPQPDASGGYAVAGIALPGAGWWRAVVTLTPPSGAPTTVPFYLVLPDPNVNGAGPTPAGSDEAQAVFARGLANMTSLHRVRFEQRLGDGQGGLYTQQTAASDGSDGHPPAWTDTSASYERIIVGDREWIRRIGQPWTAQGGSPLYLPAQWGDAYAHATGFRLGPIESIDGEPCQLVTFLEPAQEHPQLVATWYAWWVGTQSGRVRQEAMVSRLHYMLYHYRDFDAPFTITPPPAATPAPAP